CLAGQRTGCRTRPMKFHSTRGDAREVSLSEAITAGLAADGGLYVPDDLPHVETGEFDAEATLPAIAARLLAPFFASDALASDLRAICSDAFTFPAPL